MRRAGSPTGWWTVAAAALAITTPAYATNEDALTRAILANDVAAARTALAARAKVDSRLAFGATPLAWAVNTQNSEMVALLLAAGAKPDVADIDGITPLALACEMGNAEIVMQLLDARADATAAAPDGTTPLSICATYGPAKAVARMLAAGAKADGLDARGQTALMWAASTGRVEAMTLLLNAGADVNRVTKAGFTPLFFAIKSDGPAATRLLLDVGANADHRGPEGTSAAQVAVYQHNYAAAALFVPRGVDVTERDRNGNQLLHAAAAGGDVALIRALLDKGADVNGMTGPSKIKWVTEANFGVPPPVPPPTPPLFLAAANGHAEAMRLLVTRGADVRFVALDGTNVVLAAAGGAKAAALELALTYAPDANVRDANGTTPLHLLVGGGVHAELPAMLRVLAAHRARTDIAAKHGGTAREMADGGLTEIKTMFHAAFPATTAVASLGRSARDSGTFAQACHYRRGKLGQKCRSPAQLRIGDRMTVTVSRTMRVTATAMLIVSIASGSLVAAPAAPTPAQAAITARMANFKKMGGAMKALGDQLKTDAPSKDAMVAAARTIALAARAQPKLFPAGSGASAGIPTDALPAIWSERPAFDAQMTKLIAESGKLVTVAGSGDVAAIRVQMKATGATCASCHRQYRADD